MIENTTVGQGVKSEEVKARVEEPQEDFLAGVQAADSESFNVCISCD